MAAAETASVAAAETASVTAAATMAAASPAPAAMTQGPRQAGQAQERSSNDYRSQRSQTGFHRVPLFPFRTAAHN
jgi:hypothetical protein